MKKLISILCGVFVAGTLALTAADREHTLKVYNWADYIDEDLIAEFEAWYKEQTGEEVKVIYQLFDVNEIMLSKIEKGHEDFDVVCPSDYIIERMLRADLLLPIDRDFGALPNYIDSCLSPWIIEKFGMIDGSGKDPNEYSVGYMWGTTGFMYNPKYVTREEVSTWGALANPKFAGKIYMKDAFRDVYGPILIYLKQDEIKAGETTIAELMYDASDESIALVEEYLKSIKDNVQGWETDFGKEQMTKEKGWINFTWSGDAAWAIPEAEAVGVKLDYEVPAEGSNIWFDGWVIPKYARNVQAARYWINFLCIPENAIRNMAFIGYVSAIGGQEVLQSQIDGTAYEPINLSYFFGEGAESVCVNPVLYPDQSVIDRCEMMHDSGDRTEALLEMWTRVKGDNANTLTYIIVLVALVAGIVVGVLSSRKKKRSHKRK